VEQGRQQHSGTAADGHQTNDSGQASPPSWREAFWVYTKPQVLHMLLLGFAAGIPFLLVFSTLTAWLSESGVSKSTIGFFAWVGITYSVKFFWAPVVDRVPLPNHVPAPDGMT